MIAMDRGEERRGEEKRGARRGEDVDRRTGEMGGYRGFWISTCYIAQDVCEILEVSTDFTEFQVILNLHSYFAQISTVGVGFLLGCCNPCPQRE